MNIFFYANEIPMDAGESMYFTAMTHALKILGLVFQVSIDALF